MRPNSVHESASMLELCHRRRASSSSDSCTRLSHNVARAASDQSAEGTIPPHGGSWVTRPEHVHEVARAAVWTYSQTTGVAGSIGLQRRPACCPSMWGTTPGCPSSFREGPGAKRAGTGSSLATDPDRSARRSHKKGRTHVAQNRFDHAHRRLIHTDRMFEVRAQHACGAQPAGANAARTQRARGPRRERRRSPRGVQNPLCHLSWRLR